MRDVDNTAYHRDETVDLEKGENFGPRIDRDESVVDEMEMGGCRIEKFRPGSIHEEQFRRFWTDNLKASPWVLSTLENGYEIPFENLPTDYEEENNASAKHNMKEVRKIVADMIKENIVKVVSKKPKCVSPLGLVSKIQDDGSMKHRLVFDASRCLNLCIKDQKVTLSHLEKALEMTEEGDWQTVFDLKSAYYHIRITEEQHQFLGASIVNSDGSKLYFVYRHLPFGLKCAVHAITKIWKPVIAFLQALGIRSSIYIDDGRLLSETKLKAEEARKKAYDVITKAGWILETKKSDGQNESKQEKTYLGFEIDSVKMMVKKDEKKLEKILQECRDLSTKVKVSVKDLASTMGKMAALIPSHGHIARYCTRSGYVALTKHTDQFGWRGVLNLTEECKKELIFFGDMAQKYNGFPIKSELNSVKVNIVFPEAKASKELVRLLHGEKILEAEEVVRIVSDSSNFKAAIWYLDSKEKTELDFVFTEEEKATSSGFRELLAIKKAVEHFLFNGFMKNKMMLWATDSTNVVSFLEKGSSKSHVQSAVLGIAECLAKLNSFIQPIHLYREDSRIEEADRLSKNPDSDDWSIDEISFQYLKSKYKLEMDMFASKVISHDNLKLFEFQRPDSSKK